MKVDTAMSQPEEPVCDERIKNIIHHFYMVKDMPLQGKSFEQGGKGEGLIEFMKSHHGFEKSKSQYERLFKNWGWTKNRPKEEYQTVEQKVKERRKRGRESDVYLNGDLIPRKKLQKEFSRKGYMTTQERINSFKMQNENFGHERSWIPSTPPAFDIRTPFAEPLFRLIFHNLPILDFMPDLHNGLPTSPQSNSLAAANSWSLLSKRVGSQTNYQAFADAILPNSALLQEPRAWDLAVKNTEDLSHVQFFNMASFLLSNNLPSGTNGEAMYKWLKEHGGISTLKIISSIRTPTAKTLLEGLFRLAVEAGDTPVVKYLLQVGVSPNGHRCRYIYPESIPDVLDPLQAACAHGDIEMALLLLQSGSQVVEEEEEEGWKQSLLVLAIFGGNRGRNGPHHPFVVYGQIGGGWVNETALLELARRLADAGAKINLVNCHSHSPLSAAAKFRNVGLVRYLIDVGADPNFCTSMKASVLQECLRSQEEMELRDSYPLTTFRKSEPNTVARILLDAGADATYSAQIIQLWKRKDCTQLSVLDLAASTGSASLVEELIARGAIVTKRCLEFALKSLNLKTFTCLLNHGALRITWEGIRLFAENSGALQEWTKALARPHVDAQTQRYAMLAAIMYDSWELLDVILKWGDWNWEMLSGDYEEGSEEESDSDSIDDEGLYLDHEDMLEEAIAHCAEKGQLEVLLEIISRECDPMSTEARCLSIALLNVVIWSNCHGCSPPLLEVSSSEGQQGSTHPGPPNHGDLELVRRLILAGANVNHKFRSCESDAYETYHGVILVMAIGRGCDVIIEEVVKAGADLNAMGFNDDLEIGTPLRMAIQTKNQKWTNYLLEAGVDVNNPPEFIKFPSALCAAIENFDPSLFDLLLRRGILVCEQHFRVIMDWLSESKGDAKKLLQFLTCLLDEVHASKTGGDIVGRGLKQAIRSGRLPAMSLILERNMIDLNYVWNHDRSLAYSIRPRRDDEKSELVRMLLSWGADPNLPMTGIDQPGMIPLLPLPMAASYNHCLTVNLLLRKGALPDATIPKFSITPLHFAAHHGNDEMAQMLIGHGADPNVHSQQKPLIGAVPRELKSLWSNLFDQSAIAELCKNTPLQVASRRGHKKIAEKLISSGASVNAPPAKDAGATALQYAAMQGYMGIAVLLLDNGAEVDAARAAINGRTALEGAAENGRVDMVQLLLNAGANIYGEGQVQYERALNFASKNGHQALRELLEEYHA